MVQFVKSHCHGAAPDEFGWTVELLDVVMRDLRTREAVSLLLVDVANGVFPARLNDRLNACRLLGIPKPKGSVRPIAVTAVLLKLAGAMLLKGHADVIREHFLPLQYGIEVPGGTEIIVHFVRGRMRDPKVVVAALDMRAGFQLPLREKMKEVLRDPKWRSLVGYWNAYYARPSDLHVYHKGSHTVLQSQRGCKQGCSWGSFLFSLVLHPVLVQLSQRFPNVDVRAYIDDVTLVSDDPVAVTEAILWFDRQLRSELQSELNLAKCQWYSQTHRPPAALTRVVGPDGVARDGVADVETLTLLGAHLGPDNLVSAQLREIADGHALMFERLRCLRVQPAIAMLLASAIPKMGYATRCHPPGLTIDACEVFDGMVEKTWAELARVVPSAATKLIAGLPPSLGGAGFTRLRDVAEHAYAASVESCSMRRVKGAMSQKQRCAAFYRAQRETFRGDVAAMAHLEECAAKGTGVVLRLVMGVDEWGPDEAWSAGLRLRLNQPHMDFEAGSGCPGCNHVLSDPSTVVQHLRGCTRIRGHNSSAAAADITKALGDICNAASVQHETAQPRDCLLQFCASCGAHVPVAAAAAHCAERGCDLSALEGARTYGPDKRFFLPSGPVVVDTTTIGPATVSYCALGLTKTFELRAAKKDALYRASIESRGETFTVMSMTPNGAICSGTAHVLRQIADASRDKLSLDDATLMLRRACLIANGRALVNAETALGIARTDFDSKIAAHRLEHYVKSRELQLRVDAARPRRVAVPVLAAQAPAAPVAQAPVVAVTSLHAARGGQQMSQALPRAAGAPVAGPSLMVRVGNVVDALLEMSGSPAPPAVSAAKVAKPVSAAPVRCGAQRRSAAATAAAPGATKGVALIASVVADVFNDTFEAASSSKKVQPTLAHSAAALVTSVASSVGRAAAFVRGTTEAVSARCAARVDLAVGHASDVADCRAPRASLDRGESPGPRASSAYPLARARSAEPPLVPGRVWGSGALASVSRAEASPSAGLQPALVARAHVVAMPSCRSLCGSSAQHAEGVNAGDVDVPGPALCDCSARAASAFHCELACGSASVGLANLLPAVATCPHAVAVPSCQSGCDLVKNGVGSRILSPRPEPVFDGRPVHVAPLGFGLTHVQPAHPGPRGLAGADDDAGARLPVVRQCPLGDGVILCAAAGEATPRSATPASVCGGGLASTVVPSSLARVDVEAPCVVDVVSCAVESALPSGAERCGQADVPVQASFAGSASALTVAHSVAAVSSTPCGGASTCAPVEVRFAAMWRRAPAVTATRPVSTLVAEAVVPADSIHAQPNQSTISGPVEQRAGGGPWLSELSAVAEGDNGALVSGVSGAAVGDVEAFSGCNLVNVTPLAASLALKCCLVIAGSLWCDQLFDAELELLVDVAGLVCASMLSCRDCEVLRLGGAPGSAPMPCLQSAVTAADVDVPVAEPKTAVAGAASVVTLPRVERPGAALPRTTKDQPGKSARLPERRPEAAAKRPKAEATKREAKAAPKAAEKPKATATQPKAAATTAKRPTTEAKKPKAKATPQAAAAQPKATAAQPKAAATTAERPKAEVAATRPNRVAAGRRRLGLLVALLSCFVLCGWCLEPRWAAPLLLWRASVACVALAAAARAVLAGVGPGCSVHAVARPRIVVARLAVPGLPLQRRLLPAVRAACWRLASWCGTGGASVRAVGLALVVGGPVRRAGVAFRWAFTRENLVVLASRLVAVAHWLELIERSDDLDGVPVLGATVPLSVAPLPPARPSLLARSYAWLIASLWMLHRHLPVGRPGPVHSAAMAPLAWPANHSLGCGGFMELRPAFAGDRRTSRVDYLIAVDVALVAAAVVLSAVEGRGCDVRAVVRRLPPLLPSLRAAPKVLAGVLACAAVLELGWMLSGLSPASLARATWLWAVAQIPALLQLVVGLLAWWAHSQVPSSLLEPPPVKVPVMDEMRMVAVALKHRAVGMWVPLFLLLGLTRLAARRLDPEGRAVVDLVAAALRLVPWQRYPWLLVLMAWRLAYAVHRQAPFVILWNVLLLVVVAACAHAISTALWELDGMALAASVVVRDVEAVRFAMVVAPLAGLVVYCAAARKLAPSWFVGPSVAVYAVWAAHTTVVASAPFLQVLQQSGLPGVPVLGDPRLLLDRLRSAVFGGVGAWLPITALHLAVRLRHVFDPPALPVATSHTVHLGGTEVRVAAFFCIAIAYFILSGACLDMVADPASKGMIEAFFSQFNALRIVGGSESHPSPVRVFCRANIHLSQVLYHAVSSPEEFEHTLTVCALQVVVALFSPALAAYIRSRLAAEKVSAPAPAAAVPERASPLPPPPPPPPLVPAAASTAASAAPVSVAAAPRRSWLASLTESAQAAIDAASSPVHAALASPCRGVAAGAVGGEAAAARAPPQQPVASVFGGCARAAQAAIDAVATQLPSGGIMAVAARPLRATAAPFVPAYAAPAVPAVVVAATAWRCGDSGGRNSNGRPCRGEVASQGERCRYHSAAAAVGGRVGALAVVDGAAGAKGPSRGAGGAGGGGKKAPRVVVVDSDGGSSEESGGGSGTEASGSGSSGDDYAPARTRSQCPRRSRSAAATHGAAAAAASAVSSSRSQSQRSAAAAAAGRRRKSGGGVRSE